jgi:hypothetical protein
LDTLKKEYPTLSDTELLKLSLAETARLIESKNLLTQASQTFGYKSNEVESNQIYDEKVVQKYIKK